MTDNEPLLPPIDILPPSPPHVRTMNGVQGSYSVSSIDLSMAARHIHRSSTSASHLHLPIFSQSNSNNMFRHHLKIYPQAGNPESCKLRYKLLLSLSRGEIHCTISRSLLCSSNAEQIQVVRQCATLSVRGFFGSSCTTTVTIY
jgi:hypothetical protein